MAICEIQDCKCKATKTMSGEGVYHGMYLDWTFEYCSGHPRKEIEKAIQIKAEQMADSLQIVNPFTVNCELGKATC